MPAVHPLRPTRKRAAVHATFRQTMPASRKPAALPETAYRTTCSHRARANCAVADRCRNSNSTHFHIALSERSDRPVGIARESPAPSLSTKEWEKKCRTKSARTPAQSPSSPLAQHSPPPPARDGAESSWQAFPPEMRVKNRTAARGTHPSPAESNPESARTRARNLGDFFAAGPTDPSTEPAFLRQRARQSQPPQ